MENSTSNNNNLEIRKYFEYLDKRLKRIEDHLNLREEEEIEKVEFPAIRSKRTEEEKELLEFEIGQFWFAKVGIVILAIGIIFFLTLPHENFPPVLPSLFGYIIVGGLFVVSLFMRKSFEYISRYMFGGALLLLYFSTLRLHYFSDVPAISNLTIEIILLSIVVAINLSISIRKKSIYLTSLNLTLGYVTAIVSGNSYFLFIIIILLSATVVLMKVKMNWNNLLLLGIILSYFTHFVWALNNPFVGNQLKFIGEPQINILFILFYTIIFAVGNLYKSEESKDEYSRIVRTFINSMGSYSLILLITLSTFESNISFYHFVASIVYLVLSFFFWSKQQNKYQTFFYAIIGYTALSVAIINQFAKPDFFIVLSWQSILVISTAIWFRSKIIILANFIIFIIIFLAFVALAEEVSLIALSFGIVALISARILNWQKHRLELKTEMMRNAYLSLAFFIVPYALYHSIPEGYLIFSWVGVTIIYYALGAWLKNKKYRWMGHFTLLLTVIYSVFIGTTQLEPKYRILSFLVLGIVLLVVSLVFTKLKSKNRSIELVDENQNKE